MKEFFGSMFGKKYDLPKASTAERVFDRFSVTERFIFGIFLIALSGSSLFLLSEVNAYFTSEVPMRGGIIREGVVGSPRFINPLLATTEADRDLTTLVYSGLLRATPGGELIPDIAENYLISEDGLTYTFVIKENASFHDGVALTAEDVEFTVRQAQNATLKSPKRANWDSVEIEVVSEREIRFHLKQPYAPFLENATIGIIPKHVWKDASTEEFSLSRFNIEPIGSGPYKVSSIKRDSLGIPTRYTLSPFKDFTLGEPFIKELVLSFYPNQQELLDAYEREDIDAINSISPELLSIANLDRSMVVTSTLPRVFALFFNQNKAPLFINKEVREALDQAIDKGAIIDQVLGGYGVALDGPLPYSIGSTENSIDATSRKERAVKTLENAGWKLNSDGVMAKKTKTDSYTLSFSISTSNAEELKNAAILLKQYWEEIGAKVEIKVFETGDLNQNVIRPREYDTLLFGMVVGRDLDLFAFWHSSQRNDPGLNVALYTNSTADKLLSEARSTPSRIDRLSLYQEFEAEIKKDKPAIFLYAPDFIYLTGKEIKGISIDSITVSSERFLSVYKWYTETERVWTIFE